MTNQYYILSKVLIHRIIPGGFTKGLGAKFLNKTRFPVKTENRASVVYIVRLKVYMQMRRWNITVSLTGSTSKRTNWVLDQLYELDLELQPTHFHEYLKMHDI